MNEMKFVLLELNSLFDKRGDQITFNKQNSLPIIAMKRIAPKINVILF